MKRLKRGELQAMSPEDRNAHIKMLQKRWRNRNRAKLKEQNHKWSVYYWATKPFKCICQKCGKEFGGARNYFVTCPDCLKEKREKSRAIREAAEARAQARKKRNKEIIRLHKKGLFQREIGALVGLGQGDISYILRVNGYRTQEKRKRK